MNLLGSLRVTKLSLPLLKRWAVLFQGEKDKKVLIVHTPWKTIALLFLSKEDLTRCVGGGRIINVTRWEEKLSRFWSKLSSAFLDCTATRASLCTVPQSMLSRVLVTYETISKKIKLNYEINKKVLRLELAKFGVDMVTIQPGDFSKATHLLDRWSS